MIKPVLDKCNHSAEGRSPDASVGASPALYCFCNKNYELSDWLGNVRVVITDKKYAVNNGNTTISYMPIIASVTDYYSFGSQIAERTYDPVKPAYRFGFNTQEKVFEITQDHYTAKFWEYDARLGRRWNVDPIVKSFEGSYVTFANNPICFYDWLGNDTSFKDAQARKDFNNVYSKITQEIDRISSNIKNIEKLGKEKGWSNNKISRKTKLLTKELKLWSKLRNAFDEIIKSDVMFIYSSKFDDKYKGGQTMQIGDKKVMIWYKQGNLPALVHETRHGYGFLLKEWNVQNGYDYMDEYQAYSFQRIFDAQSIEKLIENVSKQIYQNEPEKRFSIDIKQVIDYLYSNNKFIIKEFRQYKVNE